MSGLKKMEKIQGEVGEFNNNSYLKGAIAPSSQDNI